MFFSFISSHSKTKCILELNYEPVSFLVLMKHDVSLFIYYFCLIKRYRNIFIVLNIQIIVNLVYFILKRVQSEKDSMFCIDGYCI